MTERHDTPLLSAVIPTRNRQQYAKSVLRAVHAFNTPELEVIVQDNSDDTSLGSFVSGLGGSRIRYFHRAERLNMHQNFDFAVDNYFAVL